MKFSEIQTGTVDSEIIALSVLIVLPIIIVVGTRLMITVSNRPRIMISVLSYDDKIQHIAYDYLYGILEASNSLVSYVLLFVALVLLIPAVVLILGLILGAIILVAGYLILLGLVRPRKLEKLLRPLAERVEEYICTYLESLESRT